MRSDRARLTDMLDAIAAITRHTAGGRHVLDDELTGAAVMRWVEIVGEAAGRVTEETRAAQPAIPWAGIVSMRNRLVHGYFDIDADRVWDAIITELPSLRQQLQTALDRMPEPPPH